MSQPLPEHAKIKPAVWQGCPIFTSESRHFFTLTEEWRKFMQERLATVQPPGEPD
jgi:hypothetical protein